MIRITECARDSMPNLPVGKHKWIHSNDQFCATNWCKLHYYETFVPVKVLCFTGSLSDIPLSNTFLHVFFNLPNEPLRKR